MRSNPARSSHARPKTEKPQLLDVPGLANRLGVTERFIRRLIAERRVPFCKIGKFVRFDPVEIEAWLNEQRVDAVDR